MKSDHNPNKRKLNQSWAKHLRPEGKRTQNKRLRRKADRDIEKERE